MKTVTATKKLERALNAAALDPVALVGLFRVMLRCLERSLKKSHKAKAAPAGADRFLPRVCDGVRHELRFFRECVTVNVDGAGAIYTEDLALAFERYCTGRGLSHSRCYVNTVIRSLRKWVRVELDMKGVEPAGVVKFMKRFYRQESSGKKRRGRLHGLLLSKGSVGQ